MSNSARGFPGVRGALGACRRRAEALNEALFSTFEPVRLWLKEHVIEAPFKKIAISLGGRSLFNALAWQRLERDRDLSGHGGGRSSDDAAKRGQYRWVLAIVEHALGCVARSTGWRSDELEGFIRAAAERPLPLVHFFEGLAQVEKPSGVKCVPWLSTRPGETQIGVRLGERDVTVLSVPAPSTWRTPSPLRNRPSVAASSCSSTRTARACRACHSTSRRCTESAARAPRKSAASRELLAGTSTP